MQHHRVTPTSTRFRGFRPIRVAGVVVAGLAVASLAALTAVPVNAAERPCFPAVLVFATSPKSELEARRLVLVAWANEARKHGEAFTSWRLAWQKTIECGRQPDGAYQCRANGKPCAIVQVPGTLPPGTKPVVRPKPGNA